MIIVGGGVSGLATAFWLRRQRPDIVVTVLEAGESAGGHVASTTVDGYTIDTGPSSLRPGAPDTTALLEALDLLREVVPASPVARRRFLVRSGSLEPLPSSPTAVLGSSLLSPAGKLRLLAEPLIAAGSQADESVSGFLQRRFGPEVAKRFAGPLVGGLVAGDPERLSMAALFPQLVTLERRHGSVLRGFVTQQRAAKRSASTAAAVETKGAAPKQSTFTLSGGMGRLTEALAGALGADLRTGIEVTKLRKVGHGFEVTLARGGETLAARNVVLATPSTVAAGLLAEFAPAAAAELRGIAYAGVGVAALAFARSSLPPLPEGFGFLAARGEGVRSLGVQFSSSAFPSQAPAGAVLLRAIVGGSADPEILELPEAAVIAAVRDDLERTLGIVTAPLLAHYRRLPGAIPQYEVGHGERVARIEGRLGLTSGLELVGNAYRGVGVNDCLRAARAVVGRLAQRLDREEAVGA